MKEVPLYDARNALSALIAEVEATGEPITITRHGVPAARLVPTSAPDVADGVARRAALGRLLFERLDERSNGQAGGSTSSPTWDELKAELDDDRP